MRHTIFVFLTSVSTLKLHLKNKKVEIAYKTSCPLKKFEKVNQ